MTDQLWLRVVFNIFILAMLALDLGVFHRRSHAVSLREAITGSDATAFHFVGIFRFSRGREPAPESHRASLAGQIEGVPGQQRSRCWRRWWVASCSNLPQRVN